MNTTDLRDRIRPVAEAEGLRLVVLFGSAARGDAAPQDVDLGLRGERPLDLVRLTNVLTQVLGRQDVDLSDLLTADPVLLLAAAEEGVALYEVEPGEFARFYSLAARRFHDTRKFREMEHEEIRDFIARTREP